MATSTIKRQSAALHTTTIELAADSSSIAGCYANKWIGGNIVSASAFDSAGFPAICGVKADGTIAVDGKRAGTATVVYWTKE